MRFVSLAALAACAVISLSSCSSPKIATSEQRDHTHVREYPGAKKVQIFHALERHVAATVKHVDNAVQMSDTSTGTMMIRGSFLVKINGLLGGMNLLAPCLITVDIKEGRARYAYSQFDAKDASGHSYDFVTTREDYHMQLETAVSFWEDGVASQLKQSNEW